MVLLHVALSSLLLLHPSLPMHVSPPKMTIGYIKGFIEEGVFCFSNLAAFNPLHLHPAASLFLLP
jgi:hypothetical protein